MFLHTELQLLIAEEQKHFFKLQEQDHSASGRNHHQDGVSKEIHENLCFFHHPFPIFIS